MNILQTIASAFTSPAKRTPARKRSYGDISTMRSTEKRKRAACDPKEYQSAVYGSTGTVPRTEELEEGEEDEEEEKQEAAIDQILQNQLRTEDDARPIATPKSRALPSSPRAETTVSSALSTARDAARASNEMLALAGDMMAAEPVSEANGKRLATLRHSRKRNDGVIRMAGGQAQSQTPQSQTPVKQERGKGGVATRHVTVDTNSESEQPSPDEDEDDEQEEMVVEMEMDTDGDVELDSSTEHLIAPAPPTTTPRRRYVTRYEQEDTGTKVEVAKLKHTPVTKQPRPQTRPNSKHPTRLSPTTPKPSTKPSTNEQVSTPTAPPSPSPSHNSEPNQTNNNTHATWSTNPNLRSRYLSSPRAIRADLPSEPAYSFHDTELRDALWSLTTSIENFATTFFPSGAHAAYTTHSPTGATDDIQVNKTFFESLPIETVKVVGCVASGGPSGVQGWHSLFLEKEGLRALVCAMVGNVVTEQVLRHPFFGGSEEGVQEVRGVEEGMRDSDGFERKRKYAEVIASHLPGPGALPENFGRHVNGVVAGLWMHIEPLYRLTLPPSNTIYPPPSSSASAANPAVHTPPPSPASLKNILQTLHALTTTAGVLSHQMSLSAHTVYHHIPLFKEDRYDSSSMECVNYDAICQRNPRLPDDDSGLEPGERGRRAGLNEGEKEKRGDKKSEKERKRAKGDDVVTQIVCMQGVTAYRRGGWEECTTNYSKEVVYERPEYENMGVRARILSHGLVFCRWGRARGVGMHTSGSFAGREMDEAAGKRIHGLAWRDGGFVEFRDVEGVVDWVAMEREKQEKMDTRERLQEKRGKMERLEEVGKQGKDMIYRFGVGAKGRRKENVRVNNGDETGYLEKLGDPDV